jgi:hypothetical protein
MTKLAAAFVTLAFAVMTKVVAFVIDATLVPDGIPTPEMGAPTATLFVSATVTFGKVFVMEAWIGINPSY